MSDTQHHEWQGKGDIQRPFKGQDFRNNYDSIFRKQRASYEGKDEDFDSHDDSTYDEVPSKFHL